MTFILALLTGFVKFKTENNKLNNSGIYYISFLVLFLVASVAMTCNQAKIRDINIASSEKNRLNDSIESLNRFLKSKEKADSIQLNSIKTLDSVISSLHEIRELQEVSSIIEASTQNTLKTQGSLLLSNDSLLKNQVENYNQITGGDNYGSVLFWPMLSIPASNDSFFDYNANTQEFKIVVSFINKGRYPIYDNTIQISEAIHYNINRAKDSIYYIEKLNNPIKPYNTNSTYLYTRKISKEERVIMFNVKIISKNGQTEQVSILKKGSNSIWVSATRIFRIGKEGTSQMIHEEVHPLFPRNKNNEVDWKFDKIFEYYQNTKN